MSIGVVLLGIKVGEEVPTAPSQCQFASACTSSVPLLTFLEPSGPFVMLQLLWHCPQ